MRRLASKLRDTLDAELGYGILLLGAVLVAGLATAPNYGVSIDEFNTDDYGRKALAWFTSGFTDRSHFETVEFSLWYYGPWFHIITAAVQTLGLADPFAIRHAMTFLIGWTGLAALLPLGRMAAGRGAGLTGVILCLSTGYLYGSLFFATIDVPFLATMTWALLAIAVMTRTLTPSWSAILSTGLTCGFAIGTRTGGILVFLYLGLAIFGAAVDQWTRLRTPPRVLLWRSMVQFSAVLAVAFAFAIAIWPWLQIGNPLRQFMIAHRHFANVAMAFEFLHWGERVRSDLLPATYVAGQLAARLPLVFLCLLPLGFALVFVIAVQVARGSRSRNGFPEPLRTARVLLLVSAAALLPPIIVIYMGTRLYDGIRHLLFIIPMLAVIAAAALMELKRRLPIAPFCWAVVSGIYLGATVLEFRRLHPLEYVWMNALAGGTAGAYGRFELDHSTVAATEAIRQLRDRIGTGREASPTKVMVCIPWREWAAGPLLPKNWEAQTEIDAADFVVETERHRCAAGRNLEFIDQVERDGRAFAWTYAKRRG